MAAKFRNHDAFDVVKIILCILIICIHTNPLPNYFQPIYRVAVPLFFIISSYLFFNKIKNLDISNQRNALRHFVKRSMVLYLFWFIALFPTSYVFFYQSWFKSGAIEGITRFLEQFIFSYTFAIPSWYIMASVIGTIIVFTFTRIKYHWLMPILAIFTYSICCFTSNYAGIFDIDFTTIWFKPQNSFLVSLIWIYTGYLFANKSNNENINKWFTIIIILLLYLEYYIINVNYGTPKCQDNYFLLVPLCYLLFTLILNWRINIQYGITLRKISTIIFCIHHPIAMIVKILMLHKNIESGIVNFTITLSLSLFLCFCILKFERLKLFSWFKYSY